MKIALDPLVHADDALEDLPRIAADMGFENLGLIFCTRCGGNESHNQDAWNRDK